MNSELVVESRRIGDVALWALWDSEWSFLPRDLVPSVAPQSWRRYLKTNPDELVRSRVLTFLLESEGSRILVDTGVGDWGNWPAPGRLLEALAEIQVSPSSIDTVVATHLHSDHVGGAATRADSTEMRATFPSARHLIPRLDWEHFTSPTYLAGSVTATLTAVQTAVLPLHGLGLIDLVEPGHRVTAAIDLVGTPGHTPGSLSVRIRSGEQTVLLIGDAAHHHAQLAEPEWSSKADLDPVRAAASRRWITQEALSTGALIGSAHFEAGASVLARLELWDGKAIWTG